MKISYNLQPQFFTLIITTIIIIIMFISYFFLQHNKKYSESKRKGFILLIDRFIGGTENLVSDVMGPNYKWFTPYAIYLFLYIGIGNLFSIIGWESPITSYTITFSLGIITFISIYIFGIWNQHERFFLKYLKNPTEFITQFSPLISITFRIFGNLTAGSTILFLFYTLTSNLTNSIPIISNINIIGGIIAPILHTYFDIFDGIIQTYIFTLLTLAYIGLETEISIKKKPKYLKKIIKLNSNKINEVVDERIDILRSA